MEYRTLGRAGVKVTSLCLGTMMFGGPAHELVPPGEHTGKGYNDPLYPILGRQKQVYDK